MMTPELSIVSAILWLLACCSPIDQESQRTSTRLRLGLARGKEIARMIYEDARLAGRLEAWSEINDRVAALQQPSQADKRTH